jgi:DNA-binding response OmpR family regulator
MARILVVEPDADLRTRQAVALSRAGHRVTGAASFESARQALKSEAPDVLITAVRLGAFNGLHLIMRARAAHPTLVAILTAHAADPILEAEGRSHGAVFFADASDTTRLIDLISAGIV